MINSASQSPSELTPSVLVTGSTGMIGTAVCRALAERFTVVGLDRDKPQREGPEFWIECDLTDDESVGRALAAVRARSGERIASVIHLAAYYDFSGEPSPLYDKLTVEGTRRLMRSLQSFEVEQFVFSSSLLVMRPVEEEGQLVDESSRVEAEWDYPLSKLAAERVIAEERGAIPAVILRLAGVYDDACHSIPIAQQMRRIFERELESYFFPGNPDHGQSFIHLEDVVGCLQAVVHRRRELGPHQVFLVGEPDVVSYAQMQDLIGEAIHGHAWPTIRIPAPLAKAGAWLQEKLPGKDPFIKPWMIDLADAHLPVDIARAKDRLGWMPVHRLRDELPRMARRILDDPVGWYAENKLDAPADVEQRARELQGAAHGR